MVVSTQKPFAICDLELCGAHPMDNKCEQIVIATNETELPTTSSGWWVVQMGFKKKMP
jgi:hypothetical protein